VGDAENREGSPSPGVRDGVHHAALPSSRDPTNGAGRAFVTPGTLRISGRTRSNRSREDAARATAIASNGPVRSSAESMPRIARMTLPTGLLSGRFWINTYAVIPHSLSVARSGSV